MLGTDSLWPHTILYGYRRFADEIAENHMEKELKHKMESG